ncbi:MAG: aspartyl/asparaginyl beta-hydroxylase domain-containing protein [Planctomycetes bacterium]|nr:aspartyl/asparaginyl beta-hydroxylase domain-containing protein [Planctomycetota bacterium]
MRGFYDPARFPFTAQLSAQFEELASEARALEVGAFVESPDSLTSVRGRYDERGWRYFALLGPGAEPERAEQCCPRILRACSAVPGLVNAGLSLFLPGTHLYPHCGELSGVLRCHLPLIVPEGDVGLLVGGELRRWREGECLVFDDRVEHEAWNHAESARVVLIVSFESR